MISDGMNKKIKLYISLILGISIIVGFFAIANPALALTCNSATLQGTLSIVNPPVSARFSYSADRSKVENGGGAKTAPQTFPNRGNFTVEQFISGLTEKTTYYYRLEFTDSSGTQNKTIENFTTPACPVIVPNPTPTPTSPAPTVFLTTDSTNVNYGGTTTLRWSSTNATSCFASGGTNGWSGNKNTSGGFNLGFLINTATYQITCVNDAGVQANSQVTVSVNSYIENNYQYQSPYQPPYYNYIYQPPIQYYSPLPGVSISADRTNIAFNESTFIRYNPYNAIYCYASGGTNGWSGVKNNFPSIFNTGPLSYTTTYSITCSNNNGTSTSNSVTIFVGNQNQPIQNIATPNGKPTVAINSYPSTISYNETSTILWSSGNATSCNARGGSVGWAGTKNIGSGSFYTGSLTESKTYTITCANIYGSSESSTTVTVRDQNATNQTNGNSKSTSPSLVLITSSLDRNQPIVPEIDSTKPNPGDEIDYTVTYQNIGAGSITGVRLLMNLPKEVDYVFSNPNNPAKSGNSLTFSLGTLRADGKDTVTVRVRVRENISTETVLDFPATLSYIDTSGLAKTAEVKVSAQVWHDGEGSSFGLNKLLGANVFSSGALLPTSLVGWLFLVILLLLLILIARKFLGSSQQNISHT